MASLQARTHLRSAHPLLLINKLVSLSAFIVLLGAGWITISYLKAEWANSPQAASTDKKIPASTSAVRSNEAVTPEVKPLTTPVRLVYSCVGDDQHYHTAGHLPTRRERSALSEDAALQRGLKPCPVCISK